MVGLIIIDFVCALIDVDVRAAGQITPYYTFIVSEACLFFYTAELIGNVYIRGCRKSLQSKVILFDGFCCVSGYMVTCASASYFCGFTCLPHIEDLRFVYGMKLFRVSRITNRRVLPRPKLGSGNVHLRVSQCIASGITGLWGRPGAESGANSARGSNHAHHSEDTLLDCQMGFCWIVSK